MQSISSNTQKKKVTKFKEFQLNRILMIAQITV